MRGVTSDGKLVVVCIRNTSENAVDVGALDIIDTRTLERVKSIPVKRGLHDVTLNRRRKICGSGLAGRPNHHGVRPSENGNCLGGSPLIREFSTLIMESQS